MRTMPLQDGSGLCQPIALGTGAEEEGALAKHIKMVIWRWQPLWDCMCFFKKLKRGRGGVIISRLLVVLS